MVADVRRSIAVAAVQVRIHSDDQAHSDYLQHLGLTAEFLAQIAAAAAGVGSASVRGAVG